MKSGKIYLVIIIVFISINLIYCNEKNQKNPYVNFPLSINSNWGFNDSSYVVIIPTNEKDKESEKKISKNVHYIFSNYEIITDTTALKSDLSNKNIIVYGTPKGNLWLDKFIDYLPITIENDKIIADKEYQGSNLRLITIWLNPLNKNKKLLIYTAQQDKDVSGINTVFHGPTQYVIASGKNILQASYYSNKEGIWIFSDIPDFDFPEITKLEMYEDYDYFIKIFNEVFPLKEVNNEIYGINFSQLLKENREKISNISNTIEFVDLLKKTIISCRGSHFWLGTFGENEYYQDFVENEAYQISDQYKTYFKIKRKFLKTYIPIFYFEGEYYFKYDVNVKNITIKKGSKILKCNGKTPDEIISSASNFMKYYHWDYKRNKSFSKSFYRFLNSDSVDVLQLDIELVDGETISLDVDLDEKFEYKHPKIDKLYKITYLEKDCILYINLPEMNTDLIELFKKDIPLYKDKPISAVVVDIRNNKGGSDYVWSELLSILIDKSLIISNKLGLINSQTNKFYIKHHSIGKEFLNAQIENIDFLNNEEFLTVNISDTVSVNENSLKYNGIIYVLADNIYSSAGSFMNICKQFDNLISVGRANSDILGIGIDPYCFSLPNSKAIFTIEPIADFSNANSAKEMHHIDVEYQIDPSLETLLNYFNFENNIKIEGFLYKHDPFFKKVLMIKNEE